MTQSARNGGRCGVVSTGRVPSRRAHTPRPCRGFRRGVGGQDMTRQDPRPVMSKPRFQQRIRRTGWVLSVDMSTTADKILDKTDGHDQTGPSVATPSNRSDETETTR